MAKKYEIMSIEELYAANKELEAKREAIHEEQRQIMKLIEFKRVEGKVSQMTDTEKKAFAQVLSVQPLETKSVINGLK